jgi:hypothetical protein
MLGPTELLRPPTELAASKATAAVAAAAADDDDNEYVADTVTT